MTKPKSRLQECAGRIVNGYLHKSDWDVHLDHYLVNTDGLYDGDIRPLLQQLLGNRFFRFMAIARMLSSRCFLDVDSGSYICDLFFIPMIGPEAALQSLFTNKDAHDSLARSIKEAGLAIEESITTVLPFAATPEQLDDLSLRDVLALSEHMARAAVDHAHRARWIGKIRELLHTTAGTGINGNRENRDTGAIVVGCRLNPEDLVPEMGPDAFDWEPGGPFDHEGAYDDWWTHIWDLQHKLYGSVAVEFSAPMDLPAAIADCALSRLDYELMTEIFHRKLERAIEKISMVEEGDHTVVTARVDGEVVGPVTIRTSLMRADPQFTKMWIKEAAAEATFKPLMGQERPTLQ